jgi:low affinity Fe/Cu permease
MLLYGVLFVFGALYIIGMSPIFPWSDSLVMVLVTSWAVVLALIALLKYKRARPNIP